MLNIEILYGEIQSAIYGFTRILKQIYFLAAILLQLLSSVGQASWTTHDRSIDS